MDCVRIRKMIDDRFLSILRGFVGDWPFGKLPTPTAISKRARKKIMSRWKSHLKGLGIKTECVAKFEGPGPWAFGKDGVVYVRDPATDWWNGPFGGAPLYIKISRDLALKIMVLGVLP